MKTNRKRLISSLIIILLIIFSQACLAQEAHYTFKKIHTIEFKKDLQAVNILLNNSNGFVKICGWDKPECRAEIYYKIPEASREKAQALAGEKTRVKFHMGRLIISPEELFDYYDGKADFFRKYSPSVSVLIYLPKKIKYDIICDTSNGNMNAKDIICSQINLNTSNGNIGFDNVQSEKIAAETSNGYVLLNNVNADFIRADTSNGNIEFKGEARVAKLNTSNADIAAHILSCRGESVYKLDTSSGKIDISVPRNKDVGVFVKASTSVSKAEAEIEDFVVLNKEYYLKDQTLLEGETKNFSEAKNKIIIKAWTSAGKIKIVSK
ncbi:MAG: DUF4097 family beta strand repeat-containing protein [Armatimonadota bacterium]